MFPSNLLVPKNAIQNSTIPLDYFDADELNDDVDFGEVEKLKAEENESNLEMIMELLLILLSTV